MLESRPEDALGPLVLTVLTVLAVVAVLIVLTILSVDRFYCIGQFYVR